MLINFHWYVMFKLKKGILFSLASWLHHDSKFSLDLGTKIKNDIAGFQLTFMEEVF